MIIEPSIAKVARKLGLDQVAIRRINCPEGKALFGGPVNPTRLHATSAFLKEALERGAEQFRWSERSLERTNGSDRNVVLLGSPKQLKFASMVPIGRPERSLVKVRRIVGIFVTLYVTHGFRRPSDNNAVTKQCEGRF